MSEQIQEYLKVLLTWKEEPGKKIIGVLTELDNAQTFKQQQLEFIFKGVTNFHREIMKTEESLVDLKWFQYCIRIKRKLKRWIEDAEKQRKKYPVEQTKPIQSRPLEYPEELTKGKGPTDSQLLKLLFKSFVAYYDESMTDPRTPPFIITTLREIKYKLQDRPDGVMNKRVISIANRLSRQSSTESKEKMLRGEITPKDLANDDEQLYFDQKTRDNIKRLQREELERNSTGFYDEMKKQINKNASEECRFCHAKAAYCEDQKQIRASDQPMTRFMRCNGCDKAWRD